MVSSQLAEESLQAPLRSDDARLAQHQPHSTATIKSRRKISAAVLRFAGRNDDSVISRVVRSGCRYSWRQWRSSHTRYTCWHHVRDDESCSANRCSCARSWMIRSTRNAFHRQRVRAFCPDHKYNSGHSLSNRNVCISCSCFPPADITSKAHLKPWHTRDRRIEPRHLRAILQPNRQRIRDILPARRRPRLRHRLHKIKPSERRRSCGIIPSRRIANQSVMRHNRKLQLNRIRHT